MKIPVKDGWRDALSARPQRKGPTGGWVERGRTERRRDRTHLMIVNHHGRKMLPTILQLYFFNPNSLPSCGERKLSLESLRNAQNWKNRTLNMALFHNSTQGGASIPYRSKYWSMKRKKNRGEIRFYDTYIINYQ